MNTYEKEIHSNQNYILLCDQFHENTPPHALNLRVKNLKTQMNTSPLFEKGGVLLLPMLALIAQISHTVLLPE